MACEIDADARTVRGEVTLRLRNHSPSPLERAYVWLLPNRLTTPSAALNDINYYWFYPRRFNPGSMRVRSVAAGGERLPGTAFRSVPHAVAGRDVLVEITLPAPVPAGGELVLRLDYDGVIPQRFGPYGCVHGRCTLVGGFYPMLAAHDRGGWDLAGPPMRGDVQVSVDVPRPSSIIIFDRWSGNGVTRARGSARDVPYASVFIGPRWHVSRRTLARGVELRLFSARRSPPADDAHGQLVPYTQENYSRYALDTAAKAVALLETLGQSVARGSKLTLVEAPLRQDLAMSQPGVVVVSDRWYRIWPARRFRKFHDRELVRAVAARVLEPEVSRAGRESPRDITTAADIVGAYAADLFTIQEHHKEEFAGDILQPVSFVPVVDQLLYAPLTMFASAYFGKVLDDEAIRDRADRFNHERPRGRLYYEKLRDLLRPEAMSRFMQAVLERRLDVRAAAEAAYGGSLAWFFRQWSLPYPRVNYKLYDRHSVSLADGRFRHMITVGKEVVPGDTRPVEPVDVLVVLEGGGQERLRWDGAGDKHTLSFESDRRVVKVSIDPKGRLVETDLDQADTHVLFDNHDEHKLRFVYNSFGAVLNVTDLSALLAADFTLARVNDPEHEVRFSAWRSASVDAGVFAEYRRAFGPAIDPDTLMSRVALHTTLQRLDPEFFSATGAAARPATLVSVGTEIRSDDRLFFFEPLAARALAFGADLYVTRRDAVMDAPSDVLASAVTSLRYTNVWTPRPGHTLAANLTGHVAFGQIRDRSQLIEAGGPFGMRGYAPDELFTRLRFLLRTEWRHWYWHDLDWNFGHYSMVRGMGGTFFVDLGALSPCDGYDVVSKQALHGSAGYGVQFAYDSFGTLPFLMRIDVAVPFVRRDNRQCLGPMESSYPPVMLYVTFEPPF